MPENHALLGASSAKRWLNCPPSVRLTENMPDTASEYAAEGTLAHSMAELKLRKRFEIMKKSEYDKKLKEIKDNALYSPEIDGCTNEYLDYVSAIVHGYKEKPYIVIEKQVDYSHIVPQGFGTSDTVILCGTDLHIIDYKHGKGVPVSAEDNPQLKLYALGAIREYSLLYNIRNVTLHIVQPRTGEGNSSWAISADELSEWGESIKETAQLAYDGKGEYKSGEHCRFCKAKAICRARAQYLLDGDSELTAKNPSMLSDDEIAAILPRAQLFAKWLSDVEEYALNQILAGREINGYKVVEGRSNRKIADVDAAFKVLIENGYDEAVLYQRVPLGLTDLEKLVTKKKFAELVGSFIVKPQGKPTLVSADDKRPEFKQDLTEIFGGNNND